MAETRAVAEKAFDFFLEADGPKDARIREQPHNAPRPDFSPVETAASFVVFGLDLLRQDDVEFARRIGWCGYSKGLAWPSEFWRWYRSGVWY